MDSGPHAKCRMHTLSTDGGGVISTHLYSPATGRENSPRTDRTSYRKRQAYSRKSRLRYIAGSHYPTRYTRKLQNEKLFRHASLAGERQKKLTNDRRRINCDEMRSGCSDSIFWWARSYFAPTPSDTKSDSKVLTS